jgi:hypothetical protein
VKLRAGQTLHSVVDPTAVIVVKAPDAEATITCGGVEMTETKPDASPAAPAQDADAGAQLGKRYVDETIGLEVLCTKAGSAALAVDGVALSRKDAKPLPASD